MKNLKIKTLLLLIVLGLISCEKNKNPEINIIYPIDNSNIGTWVDNEILVDYNDNDGQVISIQIQIDDSLIYFGDSLIDSYTWDATNIKKGQCLLTVIVTDDDNDKTQTSITINLVESGYFEDERDNQKYKWIKIGEQTWMAENLAYLPKVFPSGIQIMDNQNPDSLYPLYYVYNYQGENVHEAKLTETYINYGVLYNYSALGSIPKGWRIPSIDDWNTLMEYCNFDTKSLKFQHDWKYDKNGNNYYGLSIKPGGARYASNVGFDNITSNGKFWACNDDKNSPSVIDFHFNSDSALIYVTDEYMGYSIRCIKDE